MLVHGRTGVLLPSLSADGVNQAARLDGYGALHVRDEVRAWAEEGSYFRALTPTPGTGIAQTIQTSFSDTNALAVMVNNSATVSIIPHYVRLICSAAGATSTSGQLLVATDTASRYSSGGTDLTTEIVCANTSQGPASNVSILRFGAVTATAVTARRKMSRAVLKTQAAPCWVVGDEVRILFMGDDIDAGLSSGAAATRFAVNFGPLILKGQNHSLLFHLWNPANATTAPSWEAEFAWWER